MMAQFHANLARWSVGAFAAAMLIMPMAAQAMSITEFESYPVSSQPSSPGPSQVSTFNSILDQMINDIQKTDPARAQAVNNYFYVAPAGKNTLPPGMVDFMTELAAIEYDGKNNADKANKVDLNRAQIENVVKRVIRNMPASAVNNQP